MRSVFGATLPLAGPSMYAALTPQWAGTLLGLLEVAMVPIPFVFWKFGDRIRARSPVIRQMREEQARMDRKRARLAEKMERAAARGVLEEEEEDGARTLRDAASEKRQDDTARPMGRDVEKGGLGQ